MLETEFPIWITLLSPTQNPKHKQRRGGRIKENNSLERTTTVADLKGVASSNQPKFKKVREKGTHHK